MSAGKTIKAETALTVVPITTQYKTPTKVMVCTLC